MLLDDGKHASLHFRSHVPVARADGAAVVLPAPAGMVAHQLVDYRLYATKRGERPRSLAVR
jgi:hypothetical protein